MIDFPFTKIEQVQKEIEKIEANIEKLRFLNTVRIRLENYISPNRDILDSDDFFLHKKLDAEIEREIDLVKLNQYYDEENQRVGFQSDNQNMAFEIEKIEWNGNVVQLLYLIEQLLKNGLLPKKYDTKKYILITNHFLNHKGETFNNKKLAKLADRMRNINKDGKPKNADTIDSIINDLKKIDLNE